MKIREATINDSAALARVSVETWKIAYAGILPQDFLNSLSLEQRTIRWRERLSNPDTTRFTFLAVDDNASIIGYAGGVPEHEGNQVYTGEIGDIYILKEYQRKGIGRRLMSSVVLRLQQQGHKAVLVWVYTANPARAFYKALGGEIIGTKNVERGGITLQETAYGWRNLSVFYSIPDDIR